MKTFIISLLIALMMGANALADDVPMPPMPNLQLAPGDNSATVCFKMNVDSLPTTDWETESSH
jgi:hypothetical protein